MFGSRTRQGEMKRMPLKCTLSETKQNQFTNILMRSQRRDTAERFQKAKKNKKTNPEGFSNALCVHLFSKTPYT